MFRSFAASSRRSFRSGRGWRWNWWNLRAGTTRSTGSGPISPCGCRIGAGHVEREQQWLPVLGPQLPLAVPMPLGNGVPGAGYPWRWTICNWLDGELAALTPVDDAGQTAISLARFVAALQKIDPAGGPASEFRGTSLAGRDRVARTAATISQADQFDIGPVLAVWERAVAGPAWTGPPVWMHGDLHPANLLVDGGRLSAVIDFGLLGVGDPACDLMVAWTYLRAEARDAFRDALAVDDATWSRGRGWALELGLRAAAYSADNPVLGDIGRHTIAEVMADFDLQ
jgi:aminoglycoside phosphotransferase (APT) family kinase protein